MPDRKNPHGRREGDGVMTDPVAQGSAITDLEACLKAMGTPVSVPGGLSPGARLAFLAGALAAVGDQLGDVRRTDLYEDADKAVERFGQGYLAAAPPRSETARIAMAHRLLGYCAVLAPAGRTAPEDVPSAVAHLALQGASQLVLASVAPGPIAHEVLEAGLECLREACEYEAHAALGCEGSVHDDAYMRQCLETIEEFGCFIQYVGEDSDSPAYAYTIGLSSMDSHGYELAVSGLGTRAAGGILNALARVLATERLAPAEGLEVPGVLDGGHILRLRSASSDGAFGMIDQLLGERSTVWQALLPDLDGRFPTDARYAKAGSQELL